jgi:cellobiose-specific phosphotransferase system component IIA
MIESKDDGAEKVEELLEQASTDIEKAHAVVVEVRMMLMEARRRAQEGDTE